MAKLSICEKTSAQLFAISVPKSHSFLKEKDAAAPFCYPLAIPNSL